MGGQMDGRLEERVDFRTEGAMDVQLRRHLKKGKDGREKVK